MKIFAAGKNHSPRRVHTMDGGAACGTTSSTDQKRKYRTAGNVFFALFAAVAMVGAVGYGFNTVLRGPMKTMTDVTRRTVAESTVVTSSRLAIVGATTQQAEPDCDNDGYIEPLPYRIPAVTVPAAPAPLGGGYLPTGLVPDSIDPWNTEYGYCAWDSGSVKASGLCGGAVGRLSGGPDNKQYAIAIVSAGKDRKFQTTCNAYIDTTPADGVADTSLIVRTAGSDDIVLGYTYAEANDLGSGMWKPDPSDPNTAITPNAIEGATDKTATFNDGVVLQGNILTGGGLVLPDQTTTGSCDAVNDKQIRRNTASNPPTLEICNFSGGFTDWTSLSGAGGGGPTGPADCTGLGTGLIYNDALTGHCYFRGDSGNNWVGGKASCEADGGHLVSISSSTENALVGANLMGGSAAWIGGTDSASEGVWKWSDDNAQFWNGGIAGSAVGGLYVNWHNPGVEEPNNNAGPGPENCMSMRTGGFTWNDEDCGLGRDSICEIDGIVAGGGGGGGGSTGTMGDLVGHWKLDETSGTVADDSAGSADGTLVNAPSWTTNGINDGALIFATADDSAVVVPRSAVLEPTAVTAAAWIKPGTTQGGFAGIFGKVFDDNDTDPYVSYAIGYEASGTVLQAMLGVNNSLQSLSSIAPIPANQWTHVALTFNPALPSNQLSFYVNGILTASSTIAGTLTYDATSTGDFYIGAVDDTNRTFNGAIDDVRVYNYGLSATEIYSVFNSTAKPVYRSQESGRPGQIVSWGGNAGGKLGNGTAMVSTDFPTNVVNGADFIQVSQGSAFGCGVKAGGTVWCWGEGLDGELGNGTNTAVQSTPVQVKGLTEVVKVSAGSLHACAIKRNGSAWCWGEGDGQLGTGDIAGSNIPVQVANIIDFIDIAAGRSGSCGIRYSGEAYCWGAGSKGALGNGGAGDQLLPTPVSTRTDWVSISMSKIATQQTCGVTKTGEAYCWGEESTGNLGNGATSSQQNSPSRIVKNTGISYWTDWADVQTNYRNSCGLRANGTLWCWGGNLDSQIGDGTTGGQRTAPTQVLLYTDFVKFSLGQDFVCAVRANREAYCWGDESTGSQANGSPNTDRNMPYSTYLKNIIDISVNYYTGVALYDTSIRPVLPPDTQKDKISTSATSACTIIKDGTAWCWGNDTNGRLGNGAVLTANQELPSKVSDNGPWTQISIGLNGSSCALKNDGTAWCWGSASNGKLGNGLNTPDQASPVAVTAGTKIWTKITTGSGSTCGITTEGEAWCWGTGSDGRLGNGGSDSNVPIKVSGNYIWTDISVGGTVACGVTADTKAYCWGTETQGQLGNGGGNTDSSNVPVLISDAGPWQTISAGVDQTCGIKMDGSLWCWGYNNNASSYLGVGLTDLYYTTPRRVVDWGPWAQINVGNRRICGIKLNGNGRCWGQNTNGEAGVGAIGTLSTPSSVTGDNVWAAINTSGSCGIKKDESIWCWGPDTNGKLGNGASITADQTTPYRISTLPLASAWVSTEDGAGVNLRGGLAVNVGTTRYISGDGAASTGLNLSATGSNRLRSPTSANQLLLDTIGDQTSAQLSLKAKSATAANSLSCPYKPNGITYDGTNDSLKITAGGGAQNDTDKFSMSVWFKIRTGATEDYNIIYEGDGNLGHMQIALTGNHDGPANDNLWQMRLQLFSNPGVDLAPGDGASIRSYNNITSGVWYNALISVDTTNLKANLYINDTENVRNGNKTVVGGLIDFNTTQWVGIPAAVNQWDGQLADVWIDLGNYIDFSVEANRRKFINANGTPVYLGATGSLPTGVAADIFLSDSALATWHNNKGTAGASTLTGALDDATDPLLGTGACSSLPGYSTTPLIRSMGLDVASGNFKVSANATGAEAWISSLPADMEISNTGEMGIGTTGSPVAKLDVKGAIQIGNDGGACNAGKAGTVQWTGTLWQYCSGTAWKPFGSFASTALWDTGLSSIALGDISSCAIKADGRILCWGNQATAALGNNVTTGIQSSPAKVHDDVSASGWTDWIQVSDELYDETTNLFRGGCGLRGNGMVWCWGFGDYGRLGDGTNSGSAGRPVRTKTDVGATGWTDWKQITQGGGTVCGLRAGGTVWCWGLNAGGTHGVGASDWSDHLYPRQVQTDTGPGGWSDWKQISMSGDGICGLRTDGTLWCWGDNFRGSLGQGDEVAQLRPVKVKTDVGAAGWTDWRTFSKGWDHTCGIRTDGTLWCWGENFNGALGNNTTNAALTGLPNRVHNNDGSGAGYWSDWKVVSGGWTSTCGIRVNGTAWCWGENAYGQLGDSTTTQRLRPVQVQTNTGPGGWSDWTNIKMSRYHACGTRTNGTVWCWGRAANGIIGDGQVVTDRPRPVQVQ